ncbi:flippase-like domain-containing protein [candidate division WOR-3 bacterium]|uniref:Flippase-like domain-containing protein n=1 Tax=candidate division WOR-3 bacterium TaxID=2052148 RepID=A0A937XCL4_UNCW3|nr:flippase-like domain-containing protein [candidate division WOR-3 bacterium]
MNEQPAPTPSLTRRTIARGVRVFVFIAVAAAVLLLAFTASSETLTGLAHVKWYWLAATCALWLVASIFDGLRLAVFSRATEHRLSLRASIEIIFIGYFMAAVTPFQVGGLPLQLYIMNSRGISPGKATSLLLMRGVVFYGLLFAAAPVVAIRLNASTAIVRVLAGYIGVIIAAGAALVIASVAFPARFRRWHARLSQTAKPGLIRRGVIWVLDEFDEFVDGLKVYRQSHNLGWLALGLLVTVVCIVSLFGMSATLLAGLGVQTDALRVMALNLLLTAVLLFVPTPGASGVAEVGAAGLYAAVCPKAMLGVYVVLWRLFSFYGGALVGGILALRHISKR